MYVICDDEEIGIIIIIIIVYYFNYTQQKRHRLVAHQAVAACLKYWGNHNIGSNQNIGEMYQ